MFHLIIIYLAGARRVEMVKEAEGPKADDQQVVWKHAASEIVDMLGKVREEGKDCKCQV